MDFKQLRTLSLSLLTTHYMTNNYFYIRNEWMKENHNENYAKLLKSYKNISNIYFKIQK